MYRFSGYICALFLFCVCSILVFMTLITFPNLRVETTDGDRFKRTDLRKVIRDKVPVSFHRNRSFSDDQIRKMSVLGKWLYIQGEGSPVPRKRDKKRSYLIVIWKHGQFLERRHIKRFTQNKFSPWKTCTTKNCKLSYRERDIVEADAVLFHLHLVESVFDLPLRENFDQRWIFLTDESPIHTFIRGNQELSDYNGIFNWSMSYRSDSDIPVPYGRTVLKPHDRKADFPGNSTINTYKTKLVAIMGSNCASKNNRWSYVKKLKEVLGADLDIYGKCLGGNITACPGHFTKDCSALKPYKFYLAFENSNCREYLTEKVFWHAYEKWTIPIIMGAPKADCERLLPPRSFLHVSDFVNPSALANYLQYLNRYQYEYLQFHEWRKYYSIVNEHGYFGSASQHYCRICEALHYNSPQTKVYNDLNSFWNKSKDCDS